MLIVQMLFAGIGVYLLFNKTFTNEFKYLNQVLQLIVLVFSAAGFYKGTFFRKDVITSKRNSDRIN